MANYPEVVKRIHTEFTTASDRLLADAKNILEYCRQKDIKKGKMLLDAGFVESPEVKALEDLRAKQEDAELAEYYSRKYPNCKFITDENVGRILTKYKLVCAEVSRFTGFVPKEKLNAIAAFKLDGADKTEDYFFIKKARGEKGWEAKVNELYPYGVPISKLQELGGRSRFICLGGMNNLLWVTDFDVVSGTDKMLICAPKKDMNLDGLKKVGNTFLSVFQAHYPDPVVLQPVKRGKLIVTAWGDEASDPLVTNTNMN